MHRRWLTAVLVLLCAPLFAQDWFIDKPIRDVEFVGLDTVSENELSVTVEPFIGEPFTNTRFSELQRQLWALDLFESLVPNAVRPDGSEDEVIIRFDVVERPTIDRIEFEGNANIGRNALLDVVLLNRGDMVSRGKLRVDEEAIRALYLERGFPDIAVTSQLIEGDENRVRFLITEGGQVAIESIEFIGNQFVTASALRNTMELRERSFLNRPRSLPDRDVGGRPATDPRVLLRTRLRRRADRRYRDHHAHGRKRRANASDAAGFPR